MSLDHAILGYLNHCPMSGYDLKKHFDHSIAHFWSATQSHIYKALERLEESKFVSVENIYQDKKPNRRLYQITDAGITELKRWLTSPLPIDSMRLAWLIQVFFAAYLEDDEILEMLRARKLELERKIRYYQEEVKPVIESVPVEHERAQPWWLYTLQTGVVYYEAELNLVNQKIQELAQSIQDKEKSR